MISDEMKKIIVQLSEQGRMNFLPGATEEKIAQFEQEHGIKLPLKYKEWLLFSDGGECFLPAGVQFYGVANKPLIDEKDNNRPNDNYIVIGALSTGDPILCEKEGEQISIFNSEGNRIEDDEAYADFLAFLSDLYNLLGIGG